MITRLGCKEGSGRCVYNCIFYLVCFSQTRPKQELNQTSEVFLKKKTCSRMKLKVPFIDWRKPWILQEIAGITEGEMLLPWVNFFSAESKQ